jgi:hypothetical protein
MGTARSERDRGGFRLGQLACRAPDRGADVSERIPALDEDEQSSAIVTQPNVGRAARVRRPGRQLECSSIARRPAEPEHEFLDREVAGIVRLLGRIA